MVFKKIRLDEVLSSSSRQARKMQVVRVRTSHLIDRTFSLLSSTSDEGIRSEHS